MKLIIIDDVGYLGQGQINNITCVPRKDEYIKLNGKLHKVTNVITNYDDQELIIHVQEVSVC